MRSAPEEPVRRRSFGRLSVACWTAWSSRDPQASGWPLWSTRSNGRMDRVGAADITRAYPFLAMYQNNPIRKGSHPVRAMEDKIERLERILHAHLLRDPDARTLRAVGRIRRAIDTLHEELERRTARRRAADLVPLAVGPTARAIESLRGVELLWIRLKYLIRIEAERLRTETGADAADRALFLAVGGADGEPQARAAALGAGLERTGPPPSRYPPGDAARVAARREHGRRSRLPALPTLGIALLGILGAEAIPRLLADASCAEVVI